MEEKLTFTRVPRSIAWLCCANLQLLQSGKKGYGLVVDTFQKDPAARQLMARALPTGKGKPSLEAQLTGYGIKGFRDRLGELYLARLETGEFPDAPELERILEVREFEQRYESFSTMRDFRVFMLGFYLKARDLENVVLRGQVTNWISPPLEVDEMLAVGGGKTPKLDWLIVALSSLVKIMGAQKVKSALTEGHGEALRLIQGLDDKGKMIFFNDTASYGHAIGETDFFLYPKV